MSSPFATPRGSISGGPSALAEPTDRTPRASISGPPSPVVNESRPGQQRSASLGLPTALKPIGIINEQNTCFLNSTFQAVRAVSSFLLPFGPPATFVPCFPRASLLIPAVERDRTADQSGDRVGLFVAATRPFVRPSAARYFPFADTGSAARSARTPLVQPVARHAGLSQLLAHGMEKEGCGRRYVGSQRDTLGQVHEPAERLAGDCEKVRPV